jgi:repressor LexA
MTTGRLTPKQKQILDFIRAYAEENGYAPAQHEIAGKFGFNSLGTVQNYLVRLEREGFLRRSWNAKRALEVVATEPKPVRDNEIPLLGRVAAGQPIEAVATEDSLEVPAWMIGRGESFALRVSGDSMCEDGILNGDYVVVRRQRTAENGQNVVVYVDGEATVKRYHREGGTIELRPANQSMSAIRIGHNQILEILGVVVGVIRRCG